LRVKSWSLSFEFLLSMCNQLFCASCIWWWLSPSWDATTSIICIGCGQRGCILFKLCLLVFRAPCYANELCTAVFTVPDTRIHVCRQQVCYHFWMSVIVTLCPATVTFQSEVSTQLARAESTVVEFYRSHPHRFLAHLHHRCIVMTRAKWSPRRTDSAAVSKLTSWSVCK